MAKKVVIWGAGRISWLLERDPLRYKPCTHAGALVLLQNKNPHLIQFYAVVDPNLEKAQNLALWLKKQSLQKEKILVFSKYPKKEFSEVDLAVIAASTYAHYGILKECLEAKIPHIVIEKPVVSNLGEVKLIKKYPLRNTMIWPNYERRFHPKYQKLKDDLQKEKYGKVLHYQALLFSPQKELFPKNNYEGILLHDTTHLVDLVQFLFGGIRKSKGFYMGQKHTLFLEHTSHTKGEILTLSESSLFHFELEILTEKKRIFIGNGFFWQQNVQKSPHYSGFHSLGEIRMIQEKPPNVMQNPFLRLYKQVLLTKNENQENQFFYDALENVAILSKEKNSI